MSYATVTLRMIDTTQQSAELGQYTCMQEQRKKKQCPKRGRDRERTPNIATSFMFCILLCVVLLIVSSK